MFKLNDDLKRVLTGLAYQDAGEVLTTREKIKLLDNSLVADQDSSRAHPQIIRTAVDQHIALICDGSEHGVSIDYAIETCSRLEGKMDLLIHDLAVQTDTRALEKRILSAGIQCHSIQLGAKPMQRIQQYLWSTFPVASIIAVLNNGRIKPIIDEILSQPSGTICTPLVLIGEHGTNLTTD
ncbi:MAG: hypothetical protein P8163_06625 [Candidatus Thiodiazotropha sp.]